MKLVGPLPGLFIYKSLWVYHDKIVFLCKVNEIIQCCLIARPTPIPMERKQQGRCRIFIVTTRDKHLSVTILVVDLQLGDIGSPGLHEWFLATPFSIVLHVVVKAIAGHLF